MNLTLRQLRALVAVADTRSFRAAAERLHLTPSAVSLLVKELESAIGMQLFVRSTRRVALSPNGEEFLPLAARVLHDLERAVASAKDLQARRRGVVRLACTQLYAATLLPPVLASYKAAYPGVDVVLMDSLNQWALQRVGSAQCDFAIAPQRACPPHVGSEVVYSDRIAFFCPPDHALARRRRVSWKQVLTQPFVSLTQDFTVRLQADLLRHDEALQLQPVYDVSYVTTAFAMVAAGYGITAQPDLSQDLASTFGLARRLLVEPVVHRHICLYRREKEPLSVAAESFIEHLRASLAAGRGGARQAVRQAE